MSTPRWARALAVVSVVVVALVAAIASYAHMHQLARQAGEGWRAVLLPLSVDGMLVAASLVLLVRRRSGLPGGVLAWVALVLGLAASLVANVAAAEPTLVGRLVAAWPPVAFGISFELLLSLVRQPAAVTVTDRRTLVEPVVEPAPVVEDQAAVEVGGTPVVPGDSLVDRARFLVTAGEAEGRKVGRASLARQLGCSEHQARQVLRQLDAEKRPALHAVAGGEVR